MQPPPSTPGSPRSETEQAATPVARSPAERLREYLRVARRRWVVLASVTGIVALVALLYSLAGTKEYDANSVVLLREAEPVNTILGGSSSSSDPERETNTQIGLIKLEAVAEGVQEELELKTPPSALLEEVSTEAEGNSDLVSITVRDQNPKLAAALANAFATQYVSFRQETARASLEEAATLARNRLESLPSAERESSEGRQLEARLRELEIASSLQTGGVEVVRRATVPTSAAVPRPLLSTFVGLLVGFALAVIAVIALEFADRRLKDEDEAQEIFELPLLARMPRPARGAPKSGRGDRLRDEAYASLAANLLFLDRQRAGSVLLMTSPGAGDGKTTVTLGLARALALLGKSVIAVEADLRHPRFAERLRLEQGPGFSGVAGGAVDLADALVDVNVATQRAGTAKNARALVHGAARGTSARLPRDGPLAPVHRRDPRRMRCPCRFRSGRRAARRRRTRCDHARQPRRRRDVGRPAQLDDSGPRARNASHIAPAGPPDVRLGPDRNRPFGELLSP